jgi:hypothetical protein
VLIFAAFSVLANFNRRMHDERVHAPRLNWGKIFGTVWILLPIIAKFFGFNSIVAYWISCILVGPLWFDFMSIWVQCVRAPGDQPIVLSLAMLAYLIPKDRVLPAFCETERQAQLERTGQFLERF